MTNKLGCRLTTVIGSLVGFVGFFLSCFVKDFVSLYFTIGVIVGVGFGLIYVPAIVSVGYYFDKRRSLAMGIAVCGSGIGTFIFSPLNRVLNEHFDWQGAFLIKSALVLNICVCGVLMRPVAIEPAEMLKQQRRRAKQHEQEQEKQQQRLSVLSKPAIFLNNESLTLDDNSGTGCGDDDTGTGGAGGSDNDEDAFYFAGSLSTEAVTKSNEDHTMLAMSHHHLLNNNNNNNSNHPNNHNNAVTAVKVAVDERFAPLDDMTRSLPMLKEPSCAVQLQNQHQHQHSHKQQQHQQQPQHMYPPVSRTQSHQAKQANPTHGNNKQPTNHHHHHHQPHRHRQHHNQPRLRREGTRSSMNNSALDILAQMRSLQNIPVVFDKELEAKAIMTTSASSAALQAYKLRGGGGGGAAEVTSGEVSTAAAAAAAAGAAGGGDESGIQSTSSSFKDTYEADDGGDDVVDGSDSDLVGQCVDTDLFTNPVFILFVVSNFLTSLGFNVPYIYVVDQATQLNIRPEYADYLLSTIGISNSIGRIILGLIGDLKHVNRTYLYSVLITLCGVSTIVEPFCQSFHSLLAYAVVFGLTSGEYAYHNVQKESFKSQIRFDFRHQITKFNIKMSSSKNSRPNDYFCKFYLLGFYFVFFLFLYFITYFVLVLGGYVSLTSILLVDLLGLEKLTNAFGVLLVFQGIATSIGPPIVGIMFDAHKSYLLAFVLTGTMIALSGLMCFVTPPLQAHMARRQRRQNDDIKL